MDMTRQILPKPQPRERGHSCPPPPPWPGRGGQECLTGMSALLEQISRHARIWTYWSAKEYSCGERAIAFFPFRPTSRQRYKGVAAKFTLCELRCCRRREQSLAPTCHPRRVDCHRQTGRKLCPKF